MIVTADPAKPANTLGPKNLDARPASGFIPRSSRDGGAPESAHHYATAEGLVDVYRMIPREHSN